MNWKNIKIAFEVIFFAAILVFGTYSMIKTNKNNLNNYKGYRIDKIYIGRIASSIILIGPNKDTIDKNFENSQVEEVLRGTIIK